MAFVKTTCLQVFGVLISATDPVSVLAVFKALEADGNLFTIVRGGARSCCMLCTAVWGSWTWCTVAPGGFEPCGVLVGWATLLQDTLGV